MPRSAAGLVALAVLVAHGVRGASAQSDCEPRIVAACVLGTFFGCALVAAAVAVYLLLRRRSRRRRRLGVVDRLGKSPFRSNTNGAFATESSDSIAFTFGQQQAGEALQTGQVKSSHSKQCLGKQHWHDGGALDDACQPLQKCVTADLLSKDLGGLGLDISCSYTGGVFIKKLQDLGPAKQCGLIDIGDRIVSITVSFENIVYDDAAAILSRASPYHVRLHLLKQQHGEQQRALSRVLESSPACQLTGHVSPANGKAVGGGAGLLLHPAFARSQSLSSGAAVTGRLFRESLLCNETENRFQLDSTVDLDAYDGSTASGSSVGLPPRMKAVRTATLASNASVTALPGTVRLDSDEALRVAALVHGGSSVANGSVGSADSVAVVSSGRALAPGHHELEPSDPEHKHLRWGDGRGAAAGGSSSTAAAPVPAMPVPEVLLTEAPLPLPLLLEPPPQSTSVQPQSRDVTAVTSVAVAAGTAAPAQAQGSIGSLDHSQATAAAAAAAVTAGNTAKFNIDSHSLELQLEDGMTEDALPDTGVTDSVGLHVEWPQAPSSATADSRSRLTDSASSSPMPGGARGRSPAAHEATPDTVDKPAQRPRHLPTAVMDLVQRKEAASVVLGQLEAFATLTRNNNNPGSKELDKSNQFKMQMSNGSITIGLIQTPEDDTSILTAVLNAAKMTGEENSSDDEGSMPNFGQQQLPQQHRLARSDDCGDGSSGRVSLQSAQAEHDPPSLTTAAEIRVLAAKFGTIERSRRTGADPVASNTPPTVAGAAAVAATRPLDPRSAEEARANYFSSMLRAAKS